MNNKVFILAGIFLMFFSVFSYSQCSGSQVPCCKGKQLSCCRNPGVGANGVQLSYDLSGCTSITPIDPVNPDGPIIIDKACSVGYKRVNGVCERICPEGMTWSFGDVCNCPEGQEKSGDKCVTKKCPAYRSSYGHNVAATDYGKSVQIDCYLYSCSSTGVWSSKYTCECKPSTTIYKPSGSCGTQFRKCSSSGKWGAWSQVPILNNTIK